MKSPPLKITLLFLLLLPLLGRAQESRITGRVVDANTKEPIPFASIGLLKEGNGALTNEKGYFQVIGPNKSEQDSLIFMTLGHNRRAVFVERGKAESLVIELSPRPTGFTTICRVRPYSAKNQATPTPEDEVIKPLPGHQYAFYIENDKRKQRRKMRSVSFYVGENGLPIEPFRIRIYRADDKNHAPVADLLNERVFLTAPKAGQWCTRDLSRYNITAPKEGYFVALEFDKSASQLPQSDTDNYTPSGQTMRPAFDFKNSSMWRYSPEKGWALFPQSGRTRRYNAMVKVEVEASE